jgi:type III secretion protein D
MTFPFKIRCLNGPLSGREVMLPLGHLKLSGSDPDLLLMLPADIEATLEVTESAVRLSGDLSIWIEGIPAEIQEQTLPCGKVLDLDGQLLVLEKADAAWGDFHMPTRQEIRKTTVKRSLLPVLFGLAFLGCMSIGVLQSAPTQTFSATENIISVLDKKRQELALSNLTVARNTHGEFILEGYCENTQQLIPFYALLAQYGINYRNQVVCRDTLLQSVRSALASYDYVDIDASADLANGIIYLEGAIVADKRWEIAYSVLMQMRGIKEIKVTNREAELFDTLLNRLKDEVGLSGINIVKEGPYLQVSASTSPSRQEKIKAIIDLFNQQTTRLKANFQDIPSITDAVSVFATDIVAYGNMLNEPSIFLNNGLRLSEGSILQNGYTVEAIYAEGVSVRNGMKLSFVPIL